MKINELHALRDLGKVPTQWCRHCKNDKPVTSFYACHRTKCIECRKSEKRERLSNTEKDFCHTCSTWKSVREFDISDKGIRLSRCSRCTKARNDKTKTEKTESVYVPLTSNWELHVGVVQLFIIGPGEFTMARCSDAYYDGRIGSDEEHRIANEAVDYLNRTYPYVQSNGLDLIHTALANANPQL